MKSEEQIRIKLESLKNYKKYIDENANTMTARSWVRQIENVDDSIQLLSWILDIYPDPCFMDEKEPWTPGTNDVPEVSKEVPWMYQDIDG